MRYFDANATTPVHPRVLEAMLPYFSQDFGNAESSQHAYGWKAKAAVDKAREQVASLLGAHANEIIFTSGATESLYLAIFGALPALDSGATSNAAQKHLGPVTSPAPPHIITSQAEHKATLEACVRAKQQGYDVTFLPVNKYAQVEPDTLANALKPTTALVTLMHGNNEVGSLNPIEKIGAILAKTDVAFHVDAAQTVGKHLIDVDRMGIDLLSISAHKFNGPKGIGALYMRRPEMHLKAQMAGGGQERGLRGGTHNVPGIVGLGAAAALAHESMPNEANRLAKMRDQLIHALVKEGSPYELNGHPTDRLCNNIHFSVRGVGVDQLLQKLHDFAFSTASACSAGAASHVLQAMGRTKDDPMMASARFSFNRMTTQEEVDALEKALAALPQSL